MTGPRIPPLPPEERDARVAELLVSLRTAPDAGDRNIFATFARHPRLFKRWTGFGGVLTYRGTLPARTRELLILRVGWLCHSPYEWGHHAAIARDEAGFRPEEIAAVVAGPDDNRWTEVERALLRAVDELHSDARVSDSTWAVLAAHHDEQQLIEICMLVGWYHMVAFSLNSLGVELEPGLEGLPA